MYCCFCLVFVILVFGSFFYFFFLFVFYYHSKFCIAELNTLIYNVYDKKTQLSLFFITLSSTRGMSNLCLFLLFRCASIKCPYIQCHTSRTCNLCFFYFEQVFIYSVSRLIQYCFCTLYKGNVCTQICGEVAFFFLQNSLLFEIVICNSENLYDYMKIIVKLISRTKFRDTTH